MSTETLSGRPDIAAGVRKRLTQLAVQTLFLVAVLFLSAGRLDWWMAWVYLGIFALGMGINGYIMIRRDPALIAERAEIRDDTKGWDRTLTVVYGLLASVGIQLVAGLDVRFGWSPPIPLAVQLAALGVTLLGFALSSWAMHSNTFFAATVRIQEERGHVVVSDGPYRFMRHPGYIGWIVSLGATPVMLGSLWALVPAGIAAGLLVVRAAFEDRTLQAELDGYQDYARQVRYRLVPGIW